MYISVVICIHLPYTAPTPPKHIELIISECLINQDWRHNACWGIILCWFWYWIQVDFCLCQCWRVAGRRLQLCIRSRSTRGASACRSSQTVASRTLATSPRPWHWGHPQVSNSIYSQLWGIKTSPGQKTPTVKGVRTSVPKCDWLVRTCLVSASLILQIKLIANKQSTQCVFWNTQLSITMWGWVGV